MAKHEPGMLKIDTIIELSNELESIRNGENGFNLDDLSLWTRKAVTLKALAEDVREYMREIQEYNAEVENRVAAEDWNYQLDKELEVAV